MVKVLIAEDDFHVAAIHEKFLLTLSGINIIAKTLNARDTLAYLSQHLVDLLILDVYMPDELGTDMLPKIRSMYPNVDIIIITASTDKLFLETAIRNGIFNYLIKPVSLEKFTEIIEKYKQKKALLKSSEEVDQSMVDHYFDNQPMQEQYPLLPKGIDNLTLEKVIVLIDEKSLGVSAEEMGHMMGASRTTARRYLEYLISIGRCKAELVYGIVGRPERRYYPLTKASIENE